jgi:predicted ArsR family transcriptional regulator
VYEERTSTVELVSVGDDFEAQVAGIALLNDPVRRSLYQFVAHNGGPVSRDQAAEAAGVQRTLAAFHLDKLADEGLLDVEFKRLSGRTGPGAGRPAKLYRRSDREIEVSLPPREYDLAAHLLAAAIDGAAGRRGDVRASLQRVAEEFGREVGVEVERRAGARASASRRKDAVVEVLREHGFEPRVVGEDLVLGNCPFHSLAQQFRDLVCGMNLHLMEGLRSSVGLNSGVLDPRLEPEDGLCCVRFGCVA